mmetsp:Transcript_15363/g.37732  ORF Transcript_15363/g.37732 Transcript_15363/m.37732 type:complete len:467 (+) Transcript_15363:1086-2486(+)
MPGLRRRGAAFVSKRRLLGRWLSTKAGRWLSAKAGRWSLRMRRRLLPRYAPPRRMAAKMLQKVPFAHGAPGSEQSRAHDTLKPPADGEEEETDIVSRISQVRTTEQSSAHKLSEGDLAGLKFLSETGRLLSEARFERVSSRDLELGSALNADYYLESLPIDLDYFNSASDVAVYRRGYSLEKEEGLMLGEKLDYLQAQLFRWLVKVLAEPLLAPGRVIVWLYNKYRERKLLEEQSTIAAFRGGDGIVERDYQNETNVRVRATDVDKHTNGRRKGRSLGMKLLDKFEEWFRSNVTDPFFSSADESSSHGMSTPRYEAVFSSGPRARLLRRYMSALGLVSPLDYSLSALAPEGHEEENGLNNQEDAHTHTSKDNSNSSRRSGGGKDLVNRFGRKQWRRRARYLSRVAIADVLAPGIVSRLLKRALLEEPTFEEVVVMYRERLGPYSDEKGNGAMLSYSDEFCLGAFIL